MLTWKRAGAAVVMVLASGAAFAQFNSSIQGIVTDSSAAVAPDVAVRVTNVATGVSREARTSAEGLYRVLNLGPGAYTVVTEKEGFRSAQRAGVVLGISEVVRVDMVIEVGAISERITVSDRPPVVETEQGRVSGKIDRVQLNDLPLNGRNLYTLIALQPGITGRGLAFIGGSASGNDSFDGELGPQAYASGQRAEANSYTVDDTSVNSAARGGVVNLTPNADSVEEVRVVSNNFSAVDGRNSGAQIQVITKSGTNEFHGGASYYFQNNTLASRNLFETSVPVYRRNQFGYNLGGPIVRNRTFFFHSYEGLRSSGARAGIVTVETPAFRDWVVRTRPNSIAARLLREFPPAVDPTYNFRDLGSPTAGVNTWGPADGIPDIGSAQFVPATFRNGNQFSVRIDHEMRPGKDRLYGNVYRTTAAILGGGIRRVFDRPRDDATHFAGINHTHIFSATRINEVRAGVMRLAGRPRVPARLDVPAIGVSQITGFSTSSYPQGWFQTNYHLKDVFSWVRSAHSLKLGGEVRRVWSNSRNTTNFIPSYSFASILDFADDEPLQMTRKVDPRTGDPATNVVGLRGLEWALFVNDDWKATANLTFNLGLRYENYGSDTEVNGILRNLVFGPGGDYNERLGAARAEVVPRFYPPDNRNLAPRFGFAWNPGGKGRSSIRGGYGLAYDRIFMTPLLNFRDSPPLRGDATLGAFFGTPFTYSLGDVSKPWLGYPVDPALRLGLDSRNGIAGARVALSTTVDANLKTAYTHNWFLGIQRELLPGLVAEVSYLGSAGHRLYNCANVNRFRGDLLDGRFTGFNPSFSSIMMIQSSANSVHHGGAAQLRRAFRRGFTLQGAYTFGKTIDDADDLVNTTNYLDIANRRLDRSVAGFDVPQKLTVVGVWALPRGGLPGPLAGWQLSGFAIFQKGTPLTVGHGAAWPRGDFNADGNNGDRPNAPAGSLGRNTYRGPGFAEVDLSMSKRFRLAERAYAQIRVDAFNAFNRVNLNNPSMDLNSANFGRSTSMATPRAFQAGLRVQF